VTPPVSPDRSHPALDGEDDALELLARGRIVAVVRTDRVELVDEIVEALLASGIEAVELTLTTPGAVEALRRWRGRVPLLGAGTVTTPDEATSVLAAGARFVASPGLVRGVLAACLTHRTLCLPGTLTPTELLAARAAGARAVKWFPASLGGARLLREIRAAIPDLPVVPTGGIDAASAADLLAAGALAVGVGAWLTADPGLIGERAVALRRACATS
jgi:2-dehydro-3-deoxyphosphogluconate aldolase/(4S)-4-hydroxy-2-oxoglutarate aldolase